MKKAICAFAAIAMTAASFSGLTAAAQQNIIVYEAQVKNGSDIYGKAEKVTFNSAVLDFSTGAIGIVNPLREEQTGQTAYALPPNGESFKFSYIVDPNTARVSVAINGEIEASGICARSKNITSVSGSWRGTVDGFEASGGIKTVSAQSAHLIKSNSATAQIRLENPLPYSELSKIKVSSDSGSKIKPIDYVKDDKDLTVYFAESLEAGKKYTINAENVSDIYGTDGSFSVSFTAQSGSSVKSGSDLKLSDDTARAWGFERRIDWHEETNLSKDNGWTIDKTVIGADNSQAFFERLYAMELSENPKTQGSFSLRWDNHPYYSTLATEAVESDWTGANMFNIWMYSQEATGEEVNILIYSDNPETTWLDGYTYPIKIDWQGEKRFSIPLEDFKRFENPTGFNNVSAVHFTTKIFGNEPNPYTVLYLDDMSVTYSPEYPITPHPSARTEDEKANRALPFNEDKLNHSYPEVKTDSPAPFEYQAYYKAERALLGYYPKYEPGQVSFDVSGKAYIRTDGAHIQYLEDGKWQVVDLLPIIKKAVPYGAEKLYDVGYNDSVIRFDTDGWAYVLVNVDACSYLLWSTDGMKTWQIEKINISNSVSGGQSTARFEHIDGGNLEVMSRPPIILLNTPSWGSDRGGYMVVLTKNQSGGLSYKKIKYADRAITTAAHTGDGSFVVSRGNEAYVIYGVDGFSDKANGIESYLDYQKKNTDLRDKIPTDDKAINMSYVRGGQTLYYKNGVPAFIRRVNLTDGTLSESVFVGFGGVEDDDHNWPGISLDKEGYIHIIMNGHHDPVCYRMSKNPLDITSWTDIEQIGTFNSYGAVMTDNNSDVHIMTRDASRGYRFDTSVVTKESSGEWSKSYILKRTAPYYNVARQKWAYNPVTDEIFVFYFAQSNYFEVFKDEYDGVLFTWPNEERSMRMSTLNGGYNTIPVGTDKTRNPGDHYCRWELPDAATGREGVLVKSGDGAKTFTLVKTSDCK